MNDIFTKLDTSKSPLGQFGYGYFTFPKLEGEIMPRMMFQGRERIIWSLNNYLGLANHPEVREADKQGAADFGMAYPMGSRMLTGNSIHHERLEKELADHVKKEACFLQNFGYQGMISLIQTLVNRHDVIVYDAESHACIVDGLQLHFGKRFVYAHNDMESLERMLAKAYENVKESKGGILVITEGVFGMAGDQGKLKEIIALKEKYPFRLLVDDAHGYGTMGPTGAGTGEHQDCQDGIDVYFSTFAKSMASIGAFIAGDKKVIDFIKYNSRSQIFAKSLPMPLVIGNLKRLELLRTRPELKDNLWKVTKMLQDGLKERGFNIGITNSPVTPVFLKCSIPEAGQLIIDMRENYNIFCSAVLYPVIPKGQLMLRIIPTAAHQEKDVQETLEAFTACKNKLENGEYNNPELSQMFDSMLAM